MNLVTIESGIAQGLLWAILTLGVYLTFRILDFADLTIEGTFPLGAAVTVMLINANMNPFLAILIAIICGMFAGLITGLLHTKFKIPGILSGILTMIALYSVNIRIMKDKATVSILKDSLKNIVTKIMPSSFTPNIIAIIVGVITCIGIVVLMYIFFGTEIGCAIRATGSNQNVARALGINTNKMTILCLMISNGLIALSGSLIAQFDYGSALVNMGQGTIVIGLASVIIGEVIFIHKEHNFAYKLSAVIIGAIIYRTIIALALTLPCLKATDLKLITAIIVAIALGIPVFKEKILFIKKKKQNQKEVSHA